MKLDTTRYIRGLILLVREQWGPEQEWNRGRALITRSNILPRNFGTCRWCRTPAPSKRHLWHEDCEGQYLIAMGKRYMINDWLLTHPHWNHQSWNDRHGHYCWTYFCSECGDSTGGRYEVDHHLPIGVAWELRRLGYRGWWKAWTPQNLRPVCGDCHRKKTKLDRARMAELRKLDKLPDVHEYVKRVTLPRVSPRLRTDSIWK